MYAGRSRSNFSPQILKVIIDVSSVLHLVMPMPELEIEHKVCGLIQKPLNSIGDTHTTKRVTGVENKNL